MHRKSNILKGDIALWVIFLLLSCISLIAVYITFETAPKSGMELLVNRNFLRHALFVVGAYVLILIISALNYRIFSKLSVWLMVISFALQCYVVLFCHERWIEVPGISFHFQPSELAKLALILFLARSIAHMHDKLEENTTFYLLIIPIVVVCALVVKENFSTALLILAMGYLTLFFGNVNRRLWWKGFVLIVLIVAGALALFYFMGDELDFGRSTTWRNRLQTWMHPNHEALTQENMARMAIARGGFWGSGIGTTVHGRLMTQSYNDFIFSVIIEERGLLAGIFIFALYALFYFRCIRIASRCKGLFGSLVVAGLGTAIFLQAISTMAVNVGLLPVTGQTLPLISYGGTAYLTTACALGVIQAVAHDNKRQALLEQDVGNTHDAAVRQQTDSGERPAAGSPSSPTNQ